MNTGTSQRRILHRTRITELRQAVGISGIRLARECGFTPSRLCKVEKGAHGLSQAAMVLVAEALERLGAVPSGMGIDAISSLDPRHAIAVSLICPDLMHALQNRAPKLPDASPDQLPQSWRKKVQVTDTGCWLWLGSRNEKGYGLAHIQGKCYPAHRAAYFLIVGPLPGNLHLDHLCKVRDCINPTHLEPVSARVNVLRSDSFAAVNAAKTECKWGHPFDAANTMILADGRGNISRRCRQCGRDSAKRSAARRRRAA